jgi:hypothetical protein
VSLFRRDEPLHVRLAREGGLVLNDAEPAPRAPWDTAGIHGLQRPREWDAVLTVAAPEVEGERARFVSPGNGRAVVVEEGPADVGPLATAVEAELAPPFLAEAVRRDGGLWAIGARRIDLRELAGLRGREIELVVHGGTRTLLVDGLPAFGSVPPLERPDHVVRARRIAGDLWEVTTDPL